MGYYQTGQACINGHKTTGDAASEFAEKFCGTCGAETITACPSCRAAMRGYFYVEGVYGGGWTLADHCYSCGVAYPWMQAKLDAVTELTNAIEELTDFERSELAELLPHLVQETPRTTPAGFKIATIVTRMKGPGKAALRELLTDIAVEAGKKAMGF